MSDPKTTKRPTPRTGAPTPATFARARPTPAAAKPAPTPAAAKPAPTPAAAKPAPKAPLPAPRPNARPSLPSSTDRRSFDAAGLPIPGGKLKPGATVYVKRGGVLVARVLVSLRPRVLQSPPTPAAPAGDVAP